VFSGSILRDCLCFQAVIEEDVLAGGTWSQGKMPPAVLILLYFPGTFEQENGFLRFE
jgi:hypothetical protein